MPEEQPQFPWRQAFLLVSARVTDQVLMGGYARARASSGLYARHGGHTLFAGKAAVPLEDWPHETSVVCGRFPAEAFWAGAQWQDDVTPLRAGAGDFHIAIFEDL
jgi:uncharacterized protein (DUF1330 family)